MADNLDDAAAAIRASMGLSAGPSKKLPAASRAANSSLDDAAAAIKASIKENPMKEKEKEKPAPEVRGMGVVVIHPGSYELRLGMGWDKKPKIVKHCAARHVPTGDVPKCYTPQNSVTGTWAFEDSLREHELLVVEGKLKEERNHARDPHSRPSKKARMLETVSSLKKPAMTQMKSPPFPDPPAPKWTNVSENKSHIFGDEALQIPPDAPYEVVWPLQRGHFNQKLGVANVCNLLDLMWTNAIKTKLNIPAKDLPQYAVALVVRDTINRKEVAEMVHVLLRRMRFRSIFVLQESVAAGFGSGIATGCIVDLGHQTTSVTCIEDGYSLPGSRLEMPHGSDDISHTLQWLLRRVQCHEFIPGAGENPHPSTTGGDMRNPQDALLYHKMKEELCELKYINITTGQQEQTKYESRVIYQKSPDAPVSQWSMASNKLHNIAAMAIYYPRLAEPLVGSLTTEKGNYVLDPIGDSALSVPAPPTIEKRETEKDKDKEKEAEDVDEKEDTRTDEEKEKAAKEKAKKEKREKDAAEKAMIVGSHGGDGNLVPPMALEEAIMMSISRVGRTELKRKLFNSVLLVGGGANMKGIVGSIEDRLIRKLENTKEQVESVEVLSNPREVGTNALSWRGAAIAAQSEVAKDMYILQAEWHEAGTRILREKAPFGFS